MESPKLYGKSWGWLLYPPRKVHVWQKKAHNRIFSHAHICCPCSADSSCIFLSNQDKMVSVIWVVPVNFNVPPMYSIYDRKTSISRCENVCQECVCMGGVWIDLMQVYIAYAALLGYWGRLVDARDDLYYKLKTFNLTKLAKKGILLTHKIKRCI